MDRRTNFAEKTILGSLVRAYGDGLTYHDIVRRIGPECRQAKKPTPSLRHLVRLLSALTRKGIVQSKQETKRTRFWITIDGYLYYHSQLLKHDTSSLDIVPRKLM